MSRTSKKDGDVAKSNDVIEDVIVEEVVEETAEVVDNDEPMVYEASVKIVQKPKIKGGAYGEPNFIRLVEYKEKVTTEELALDIVEQINGIIRICEKVALHNLPMRSFMKIKKGSDLFFTIIINGETKVTTTHTPMQLAKDGNFLSVEKLVMLAESTVQYASNDFRFRLNAADILE